jgi:predicted nucleic acid-binding protein
MTSVLVDSSVLIKWFHAEGESEVAPARVLRDAHVTGELDAYMLDLGFYEIGNVLTRALRWDAADVADQLDDLAALMGVPMTMEQIWWRDAANLAVTHQLSYYDASLAAVATGLGIPLVSADKRLLAAGLAALPDEVVAKLLP